MAEYRLPSRPFQSSGALIPDLFNLGGRVAKGVRDWGKPEFSLAEHTECGALPQGSYARARCVIESDPRLSPEVRIAELEHLNTRYGDRYRGVAAGDSLFDTQSGGSFRAAPQPLVLDPEQSAYDMGGITARAAPATRVLDPGQRYVGPGGEGLASAPFAPTVTDPEQSVWQSGRFRGTAPAADKVLEPGQELRRGPTGELMASVPVTPDYGFDADTNVALDKTTGHALNLTGLPGYGGPGSGGGALVGGAAVGEGMPPEGTVPTEVPRLESPAARRAKAAEAATESKRAGKFAEKGVERDYKFIDQRDTLLSGISDTFDLTIDAITDPRFESGYGLAAGSLPSPTEEQSWADNAREYWLQKGNEKAYNFINLKIRPLMGSFEALAQASRQAGSGTFTDEDAKRARALYDEALNPHLSPKAAKEGYRRLVKFLLKKSKNFVEESDRRGLSEGQSGSVYLDKIRKQIDDIEGRIEKGTLFQKRSPSMLKKTDAVRPL